MLINLLLCDKGKKADEENPEGSNVSPKSRHEGEECNCSKCVLIVKEYCIDWVIHIDPLHLLNFWIGYLNDLILLDFWC